MSNTGPTKKSGMNTGAREEQAVTDSYGQDVLDNTCMLVLEL